MSKITYDMVRQSPEIRTYIEQADASLSAMGFTEHSFAHVERAAQVSSKLLADLGYSEREVELARIEGFMHDIGKFSTWTIEEDTGRHRFIKHDDVGAKLAAPILKSMNLSNKQVNYVVSMIKNHIYPSQLMSAPEIDFSSSAGEKAMMRYIRKMDDNVIDNIILAKADRLSARGEAITEEMVANNLSNLDRLLAFYLRIRETLEPLPILLNGNDVMKLLNIKPSRELGKIMDALHEAQLSSEVTTKGEAESFVMKNFLSDKA